MTRDRHPVYLSPVAERRLGEFFLSDRLLHEAPEAVFGLMADKVVIRCEHDYACRGFRYTAYCPVFAPVPDGERAPEYKIHPWYVKARDGQHLERLDLVREG